MNNEDSRDGGTNVGAAVSLLYELTLQLRTGCPWDRAQTAATIVPHTLEEAYEVCDAVASLPSSGSFGSIDLPASNEQLAALARSPDVLEKFSDELGDLLFQVCFLSMWCSEQDQAYDLATVAQKIHGKLVRRHPHIFGDASADTADEVRATWDDIKNTVESSNGEGSEIASVFKGISTGLPTLQHATKVHTRAARAGFDFDDARAALDKVLDELTELREALDTAEDAGTLPRGESMQPDAELVSEIGDVMFSLVNFARTTRTDPDLALRAADKKFVARVQGAEHLAHQDNLVWADLDRDQQEVYYQRAKALT